MNSIRLTQNNFKSPLTLAISTATQNSAQTSSYFIPGQHFLEIFTLLSPNNQDHTFMDDDNVPILNQQTRLLLHLWRPYLTHTFNNALTVTLHISLKHLAAKIPYQLHNYFLPSFLRNLQHKRKPFIPRCQKKKKKLPKRLFDILVLLSFIYLKT